MTRLYKNNYPRRQRQQQNNGEWYAGLAGLHPQIQSSAKAFKLEHQSKQAKRNPMAKSGAGRRQAGRNQAGGERTFETAKQARSEKAECDAILRVTTRHSSCDH